MDHSKYNKNLITSLDGVFKNSFLFLKTEINLIFFLIVKPNVRKVNSLTFFSFPKYFPGIKHSLNNFFFLLRLCLVAENIKERK